jgi:peroxiredoxin
MTVLQIKTIRIKFAPYMTLKIGDTAADFSLYNTEKELVQLSQLKGSPVVLLFFPLAFTATCTAELCSVRDDIANYQKLNAKVFGISVDSIFSLKKFQEEQQLNFPLLSDFNKTASLAYDSLYESFVLDMKGVSKRSAFVIDAAGVIQYAEVLEKASDIPNLEAIQSVLATLS